MKKYVYFFNEGKGDMKSVLGGKGAGLAEMTRIGIPVPQGFTITTEVCVEYYKNDKRYPQGLDGQIEENLKKLEQVSKKGFGDSQNPLLVSVRSGAPISMPGMMDTVLNLGLNDVTIQGVIEKTKNERFAYDSYRRFMQMFGNVVLGIEHDKFEHLLEELKRELKVKLDTEIDCEGLKILVERYKKLVKQEIGKDFPQEPKAQLKAAIDAVFNSWNTKIPDDLGTAVNVQEMVFGNMGEDSGTGVGFTRNPSTGEKEDYGEYLLNAQGEDVVAGIRTPLPLSNLKNDLPGVYKELIRIVTILEKHYRDVQDYEFTIEKGKLYLLQTRTGKRTAQAALKIAVDMVEEGIINKEEAILRVEPNQLNQLLHRRIDPKAKVEVIAKGLPASPGAAYGKVVFTADEAEELGKKGEEAEELGKKGESVILVRTETTPDDIHGMVEAQGVLTSRGGMTSHAAVVARGMGKACVAGCSVLNINIKKENISVNDLVIKKDEFITIDGGTGEVFLGKVPTIEPKMSKEFETLLSWANEIPEQSICLWNKTVYPLFKK